ncbi:MAG: lactate utilization protein [Nitrococcus sp.]|nr:lactate utilization protein [Nitrococcus sp.]
MDYLEEVWERLLAQGERMPRAVNLITGPSRTADVEQTMQLGAHGPRRVHLLLIG